ncbi:MAG: glycosyltransferase family 4 protein [Candidatus Woesearchaeota archaeon]|nr:glycosyltransferase family 4 protein [Candidatus Woesearchaeota archaeon]
MKTIMVTIMPGEPVHGVWKNFLKKPPAGFRYVNAVNEPITFDHVQKPSKIFSLLYGIKRRIPFVHHMHRMRTEEKFSAMMDTHDPDLIYCTNGRVYLGKKPWVVDLETPSVFFGYNFKTMTKYKDDIKKILLRSNCKAILPYSRVGKEGMIGLFGKTIAKKITICRNAVLPPKTVAKKKHKDFTMLFTGSSNIADNFYSRGGKEMVHAFLALAEKYTDVKLVLRCSVPKRERQLLKGKNVIIHEGLLDRETFEGLFTKSDVYLFPAYIGYGLTVYEAMSWGLPIVTADIMENGEPITNGVNGFKVRPPHIDFWLPGQPDYYFTGRTDRTLDVAYVERLVAKLEYLYVHPKKRARMGRANRQKARKLYSLTAKNKVLKKVFTAALRAT